MRAPLMMIGAAAALLPLAAPAAAGLTAQKVQASATVDADPLEFVTVISTERAHRGRAAKGTLRSDAYLVALVEKSSGRTQYELRKEILYVGPRRDYRVVQFLDEGRLRMAPLSVAQHGADQCPNSDFNGNCHLTKTLAFPLDEGMLRRIAGQAGVAAWTFKLKEARGQDVEGQIAPAEAEGLLRAVADYRASLGAPTAS